MEDCCAICAEPMQFVGIPRCGHKEVCCDCTARLRFVMQDNKCPICKQESQNFFGTKYMGDYTSSRTSEQFDELESDQSLMLVREIGGYFDDKVLYDRMRQLCSYSHPVLDDMAAAGEILPEFTSLSKMRRFIREKKRLQFCDLCLKGRKVFLREQLLYTRQQLEQHMTQGDQSGPLKEAGFKGHALCKFCNVRFYSETELYTHMERQHEHCFICRRRSPSDYTYFRDYDHLQEHFGEAHWACQHPTCLEKRFVVFGEKFELMRHMVQEHGEEWNLSKQQKKQALTIVPNFQVRGEEEFRSAGRRGRGRGRDGGGRGGRGGRGGGGGGANTEYDAPPLPPDGQGPVFSRPAAGEDPSTSSSATVLREEDFPAMEQRAAGAALVGTGRWGGASHRSNLSFSDFPTLPGQNKNAKRRAKQREKRAAQAVADDDSQSGDAAGPSYSQQVGHQRAGGGGGVNVLHSASAPNLAAVRAVADSPAPQQPSPQEAFPVLAAAGGGGEGGEWQPVTRVAGPGGAAPAPWGEHTAKGGSSSSAIPTKEHTGPTLGLTIKQGKPKAGKQAKGKLPVTSEARSQAPQPQQQPLPPPPVAPPPAAAPPPPTPGGGSEESSRPARSHEGEVSEGVRALSREVMERVKASVDKGVFALFRGASRQFLAGKTSAEEFSQLLVEQGLTQEVATIAALCSDERQGNALVAAALQKVRRMRSSGEVGVTQAQERALGGFQRQKATVVCPRCGLLRSREEAANGECEGCELDNTLQDEAIDAMTANVQTSTGALTKAAPPRNQFDALEVAPTDAATAIAGSAEWGQRQSAGQNGAGRGQPSARKDMWPTLPPSSQPSDNHRAGNTTLEDSGRALDTVPQSLNTKAAKAGSKKAGAKKKGIKVTLSEVQAGALHEIQQPEFGQPGRRGPTGPAQEEDGAYEHGPRGVWGAAGGSRIEQLNRKPRAKSAWGV